MEIFRSHSAFFARADFKCRRAASEQSARFSRRAYVHGCIATTDATREQCLWKGESGAKCALRDDEEVSAKN